MERPGTIGDHESDRWDDETLADALDVLDDVQSWQLAEHRWDQVDHILESMERAVRAGDVSGLRDATADLELTGPVRATRIGAATVAPPPEPVRERRNRLVHSLGGVAPQRDAATDRENGHGRNSAG